jgi:hypothetical protein
VCACPGNTQLCDGVCIDTTANVDHCGGCGVPCEGGLFCLAGACVDDCGALAECSGACVNTDTNDLHCGGCNAPCAGGQSCAGGSCDCPGPAVSYAADIEPIFGSDCTAAGCHGFPMPKEDLDLRAGMGYADLVAVASNQCADKAIVEPGQPAASYLVDKLLGVNLCFGSQMPKDPPPLDPATIAMVSAWICQGAPP